jgi:hypothetical protein
MLELTMQERDAVENAIRIMKDAGMSGVVSGLESIFNRSNPEPTTEYAPYAVRHPEDVVLDSKICPEGKTGTRLSWLVANVGFGHFTIYPTEDGKGYKIWNECMGPEFIKHVLNHLVDNATLMEP